MIMQLRSRTDRHLKSSMYELLEDICTIYSNRLLGEMAPDCNYGENKEPRLLIWIETRLMYYWKHLVEIFEE